MDYSPVLSSDCSRTTNPYIQNLTSNYTDQRNEASVVATSVLMFLLAALFFNLNLFSRLSDVNAILNPRVRLFLSSSLALFLPVMSYLFSEAKNDDSELSLRARTILMWMLLVELLRNKVEAILGKQGYSATIERAGRVTWLGLLVFFNVSSSGRKTIYAILWVLAATKLVQRVAISEAAKHSFAYGKNTQLLTSYMAQVLEQAERDQDPEDHSGRPNGRELLTMCNYAVMGEDELVMVEKESAGPRRYKLQLKEITIDNSAVVTVSKIWKLSDESDRHRRLLQGDTKRLCLSFALHKLLRRRFEDLPITDAETGNCRRLIFKGLCSEGTDPEAAAVALFQLVDDELQFLSEYYHSVFPVVFASSFFFLANYIMLPITVWALCILTMVLCSNGDVAYAIHSIKNDNYTISVGLMKLTGCVLHNITKSPTAFFAVIDMSITVLLFLTFIYEEVWELLLFLLSKWLTVSLLSDYTAKPHLRKSTIFRGVIRSIMWVRGKMCESNLCFKQFSLMGFFRLHLTLPIKAVPKEIKTSIMEYLLEHVDQQHDDVASSLSNGWSLLAKHPQYQPQLTWACESESVAEVILTWHIATSLFEETCPPHKKGTTVLDLGSARKVAAMLSKYCAYLVAFYPELLPDDKDGTERVYKALKEDLKAMLGCWCYYLSPQSTRCNKLLLIAADHMPPDHAMRPMTVVQKGALLGKTLIDKAEEEGSQEPVWKLLADLWTELMVYVAPSSSEVHVKAHKETLAHGSEFVTLLWALATHTGITRPAITPCEEARR